jgi:hypothetical protein
MKIILIFIAISQILTTQLKLKVRTSEVEDSLTFEKRDHSTNWNDAGRGSIFYLDRHDLDCGNNSAINFFHLQRLGWNQIRYFYKCIKSNNITNECSKKSTPQNDTDGNERRSVDYLDRHDIRCDDGTVIRQFKLGRNGRQIFYEYTCCKAQVQPSVGGSSNSSDKGDRSNFYLDRQPVDAREFNVMNRIKLETPPGQYRYSISYNTLLV